MDLERYTERAKGFLQAAQNLALREGHQQFGSDHLLKVLLDDPEGLAAGLVGSCPRQPGPCPTCGRLSVDPGTTVQLEAEFSTHGFRIGKINLARVAGVRIISAE